MAADVRAVLHVAIQNALIADPTVAGLVNGQVFRMQYGRNAVMPYIVVGETSGTDDDTKTSSGMGADVTVHVFDQSEDGAGTLTIQEAVSNALNNAPLTLPGYDLIQLRHTFSSIFPDPDGSTQHGVQTISALTEKQ